MTTSKNTRSVRYHKKPKRVFIYKGLFKGMQHALMEFDKLWAPCCSEIASYAGEHSSLHPKFGNLDLIFRIDLRIGKQADHSSKTLPCFWVTTHALNFSSTELYIPHSFQVPFEYLRNNKGVAYMLQLATAESKTWIDEMFARRGEEKHQVVHP